MGAGWREVQEDLKLQAAALRGGAEKGFLSLPVLLLR
jgi:hypothetical protein